MNDKIRVMLVDDQRLMRDGLRMLLELETDFDIVAELENGQQAVDAYAQYQPDVILMDVRMPVMNGVDATIAIRQAWPQARILILTTFDDDNYVFSGIRAGAMGYLLKDLSGAELAYAIRTIAAGGALIGPEVAAKVMNQFAAAPSTPPTPPPQLLAPLSQRETEILHLMAQGFSNPKIAKKLFLAEGTIKNYVSTILQKLDARDRTQAVVKAKSMGII